MVTPSSVVAYDQDEGVEDPAKVSQETHHDDDQQKQLDAGALFVLKSKGNRTCFLFSSTSSTFINVIFSFFLLSLPSLSYQVRLI